MKNIFDPQCKIFNVCIFVFKKSVEQELKKYSDCNK